ncbi:hypothetical protein EXS73_00765 [Candidatus Pacearchaeota archaeon]|nr:hypothetical protein [Candidatus Pacearchaeota archaeon]
MKIKPVQFDVGFPLDLFEKNKINFRKKVERKRLFKRNLYYQINGKKNKILEKRWKIFNNLANIIEKQLLKERGGTKIKSISVFGSGLHSENNEDYDFLVIIKGNTFQNIKKEIKIKNKAYSVGVSIKGEENLSKGIIDKFAPFDKCFQRAIINRTSISLPWRHLPIKGVDFKENKIIFLKNCPAQIYDLLFNAYNRYYLKDIRNELSSETRKRKILSRIFEASKYIGFICFSKNVKDIQKKVSKLKENKETTLTSSKKIFNSFVNYYNLAIS